MFGFLIIVLCIVAYFHCKQKGCCNPFTLKSSHQDALDIVKARYARGEINTDEFIERKRILEEGESKV